MEERDCNSIIYSKKVICILILKKVLYNLRLFLKWLITWFHPPSINKWLITLFPTLSRPFTNQIKSTNANIPNINWHETHKKGILVNKHSMVFSLEKWEGDFFFRLRVPSRLYCMVEWMEMHMPNTHVTWHAFLFENDEYVIQIHH